MRRANPVTTLLAAAAVTASFLIVPSAVHAQETRAAAFAPDDYCLGQCGDIVPPGNNGNATLAEILTHKAFGTRPAHSADQLGKYDAMVAGYGGLSNAQLGNFFNDASFGVPADQVESTIKPRADVTIVRDKKIGMPHITGTTRSGTMFGAGYAAGQDRLWLMDIFRHLGRGQLSGYAGGAPGNRVLEQSFYNQIPYTEADLQKQIETAAAKGGERGRQALLDVNDYISGINAYLTQSVAARNFPGEYVLTGHADSITNWNDIQPFKATDMVAIAGGRRRPVRRRWWRRGAVGAGEARRAEQVRHCRRRAGVEGVPGAERPRGRPHPPQRTVVPVLGLSGFAPGRGSSRRRQHHAGTHDLRRGRRHRYRCFRTRLRGVVEGAGNLQGRRSAC